MSRNRRGQIILGAQRSGKSFYTNQQIKKYISGGGAALVYNLGKETDFDSCELGSLMTEREHLEHIQNKGGKAAVKKWKEQGKPFMYIETKSGIIKLKEFNYLFRGKGLKVKRLSKSFEASFFHEYFKHVSNTFLVFDDAKPIFRDNLTEWAITLLSRMNHTGTNHLIKNYRGAGSDIAIIFHSLNHISSQLLDYYNDDYMFISFAYKEKPDFDRISNIELRNSLRETFYLVPNLPKYSFSVFFGGVTTLVKKNGLKYVKKSFIIN